MDISKFKFIFMHLQHLVLKSCNSRTLPLLWMLKIFKLNLSVCTLSTSSRQPGESFLYRKEKNLRQAPFIHGPNCIFWDFIAVTPVVHSLHIAEVQSLLVKLLERGKYLPQYHSTICHYWLLWGLRGGSVSAELTLTHSGSSNTCLLSYFYLLNTLRGTCDCSAPWTMCITWSNVAELCCTQSPIILIVHWPWSGECVVGPRVMCGIPLIPTPHAETRQDMRLRGEFKAHP